MNLSEIVCSLENAIKLKDLGIKQESQFYFVKVKSIGGHELENEIYAIAHISQTTGLSNDWISALTVQELLSMLNACIRISIEVDKSILVWYQPENGLDNSYNFQGDNLADLLAEVLIAQINEGEFKND